MTRLIEKSAGPVSSKRLSTAATIFAAAAAMWTLPVHAFRFGSDTEGLSGSFDSTISYGVTQRTQSTNCSIISNDNGGCNNLTNNQLNTKIQSQPGGGYANADYNFTNSDDGNLNYRKGDIVSSALKGTHDLSLRAPDGWSALLRATWHHDFKIDDTARTPLNSQARDIAVDNVTLLDAWIAKEFDFNGRRAKVKLGNQVLSWGEEIFIGGGINQIHAFDIQKAHVPGTQLKEIFIPAQMLSGSASLTDNFNVEAYYQWKWNDYKFDPSGTYWSTADTYGKGRKTAYTPTSLADFFFGAGFCAANTPTGRCGDPKTSGLSEAALIGLGLGVPYGGKREPDDSGQYGLALRYRAESIDSDIGFYYQRYHDKFPFLGFTADPTGHITSYYYAYGQDKDLYGISLATNVASVALGFELSYRPEDSVAVDPTVPFGQFFGGAATPNKHSIYDVLDHPGYVEEKKWQFHSTALYTFGHNDPVGGLAKALGAADGIILAEAAVTHYSGLDRSGRIPYYLPNYDLPTSTSWGYVAEIALNYPNAFDSGVTVTPQIDWFHDVSGTSPNAFPFVEGRKTLGLSLFFNYRDRWKGALQWTQFMDGGNNNLLRDRDNVSANISYSF